MILICGGCGASLDWKLGRAGNQPMLMSNCRHCNPGGPWFHEPIEIIVKPRGKRPDQFSPITTTTAASPSNT